MHGALSFLLTLAHSSGSLGPAPGDALRLRGELAAPSPWSVDVGLRAERFGLDGRRGTLAQPAHRRAGQTAPPAAPAPAGGDHDAPPAAEAPAAETPAEAPAEATTEAPAEAPAEACDVDCETAHEDARLARYVTRNRNRTLRTHRAFAIAAWSSMLVTEVLGTVQAVNQDTWFGRGNCASDPEAFGCRQSSLLTGLHLGFAITTVGLYTTAGVLAVAAPDPDNASEGESAPETRLRRHKALAFIHGAGMILLPILGILASRPQILGINDQDDRAAFSRAMRTMHLFVGYTTFAALTYAAVLEF